MTSGAVAPRRVTGGTTRVGRYNGRARIRIGWLSPTRRGLPANLASLAVGVVLVRVTLLDRLGVWWPETHQRALIALAALVGLVVVVLVHELGHAVVLAVQGLGPVEVRVSPGLGFVRTRRDDVPWPAVLAGPVASIVAGLAVMALVRAVPIGSVPTAALRVGYWSGQTSAWLGLANLLPVFPLDGHRLLGALVGAVAPGRRTRHLVTGVGVTVLGFLVARAVADGEWLAVGSLAPLVALAWLPWTGGGGRGGDGRRGPDPALGPV